MSTSDFAAWKSDVRASFTATIMGGYIAEKQPSSLVTGRPSFDDVGAFLCAVDVNNYPLEKVSYYVRNAIRGRSFFMAKGGLFGLCPEYARVGDSAAVNLGCNDPLILRPAKSRVREATLSSVSMSSLVEVEVAETDARCLECFNSSFFSSYSRIATMYCSFPIG